MSFLRGFLFIFLWFTWTLLWGVVSSPMLILEDGKPIILQAAKMWARVTIFLLKYVCCITSKIVGMNNIPKIPSIIASKHQSAWETIFFLVLFDNPVFVIKKELTKIPIYGWYLRKIGMICIDRKGGINALKQIKLGVESAISQGRPVIIFPEGTRVSPNEKIKLKSGIKFLHESFPQVPIIPIALNSGFYWINKSIETQPGIIKVKIHPKFVAQEYFLEELCNLLQL